MRCWQERQKANRHGSLGFRVQGFGLLEGLGDSVSRLKAGLDGPQLGF